MSKSPPPPGSPEPTFRQASDAELGDLVDEVLKSNKFASSEAQPSEPQKKDERFHPVARSNAERREQRAAQVEADAQAEAEAARQAAADEAPPDEWYVVLEGRQVGPFTLRTMEGLWDDGTIDPDMLCWRAGLADWAPVRSVEDLVKAFTRHPNPVSTTKPVDSSGSWRPVGKKVLERLKSEQVKGKRVIAPPPIPAAPPDVSEVIRSAVTELRPLLETPPARGPGIGLAIASGVVSGALVAALLLYAKPPDKPPVVAAPAPVAVVPVKASQAQSAPIAPAGPVTTPRVHHHPRPAADPAQSAPAASPKAPKDAFEKTFGEEGQAEQNALPEKLETSAIMSVVLSHKGEVSKCMQADHPTGDDVPDKVVMRWSIHPDGRTDDISTQTEAFMNTPLASCLKEQIGQWTFPKHQAEGEPFSFPFKLSK